MSWVGLRGAVPIVFATYPLIAGIDKASIIFNIVFFISLTSILIQGTSLSLVANWLHVALPEKLKPKSQIDGIINDSIKTAMAEINIPENNQAIGLKIVDLGFPKTAIIAMLKRKGQFITPNGTTEIQKDDQLLVLAEDEISLNNVYNNLNLPHPENEEEETE